METFRFALLCVQKKHNIHTQRDYRSVVVRAHSGLEWSNAVIGKGGFKVQLLLLLAH
jgi:hypothetical protein